VNLDKWCFTCEKWCSFRLGVPWHFIVHPRHRSRIPGGEYKARYREGER
jgi:hypothetical protein